MGLPGIMIVVLLLFLYSRRNLVLWAKSDSQRRSIVFGRMAGIIMGMIAVASFFDYPLRTPMFMSIFALLALWFDMSADDASGNDKLPGIRR
jgi:hypothetical protein